MRNLVIISLLLLLIVSASVDAKNDYKDHLLSSGECINPEGDMHELCIYTYNVENYGNCTFAFEMHARIEGSMTLIGCKQ